MSRSFRGGSTIYRPARTGDEDFIVEMARHAGGLEDRPLPDADAAVVQAVLPPSLDGALIATDDTGRSLGTAWWHWHEPPLLLDPNGQALPEMIIAVVADVRGQGIGAELIESLAHVAAARFAALAVNVHVRNPAVRLYTRTGFVVAGQGRGRFGVAMSRDLRPDRDSDC